MRFLYIFWYDIIEDYVFYDGKTFYGIGKGGKCNVFYSPRMEFVCEIYE